jgi:hypothetical protein
MNAIPAWRHIIYLEPVRFAQTTQKDIEYAIDGETIENFSSRTFRPDDATEVIDLWRECGLIVPWNNPQTDIDRKYTDSAQMFFVGELENELVASCMAGYDGHRGWIYFTGSEEFAAKKRTRFDTGRSC